MNRVIGDIARAELRDNRGAIADYYEAIYLNPDFANAYYNHGMAKYSLIDKQGAISDFREAARPYQQGKTSDLSIIRMLRVELKS